jgi:mRNA interferase RelE/StbE
LAWQIEFDEAAKKERLKLDPPMAKQVFGFMRERLLVLKDPRPIG